MLLIISGAINLLLAGLMTIIFFAIKNYIKSTSTSIESLKIGQADLRDAIHDWKFEFAQKYAEKEDNKSSHKNMWTEIRRLDRMMVYLASKSNDIDIKDMQAIAGGDHG